MSRLAYYRREREDYKEDFELKMSDKQVEYLYKKLQRRFGLTQPLVFFGHTQSGSASRKRVRVSHNASIAVLAHEVAHLIQFKKRDREFTPIVNGTPIRVRRFFHTNEHRRLMKKVLAYIKSHLPEWLDEIEGGMNMKKWIIVKRTVQDTEYVVDSDDWKNAVKAVMEKKAQQSKTPTIVRETIKRVRRLRDAKKPETKPKEEAKPEKKSEKQ